MSKTEKQEAACLPERFAGRMRKLLSGEWEHFLGEWGKDRLYGLRVNTLKISTEEFERIAPFHISRIPWIPNGYYYEREANPAGHPFYAAGLYYLQEPSAMTPASRLKAEPGDKVLDLCAAPGGKATDLAAGLEGRGLIVANDINQARARALLRNMELFGVTNSMVTNEPPHILAQRFPEYFDKIMVDAPCSGEGMFRKNPAVMDSWLEKGPEYFSSLQKEIILHAADMLRPGGQMFYSTCTFAPEENEGVISHLLARRPEMEIIPMEDYEGFSPGILSFDGMDFHEDCRLCRRIWPHKMAGEGHFLALLYKKETVYNTAIDTGRSGYGAGYNNDWKTGVHNRTGYNNDWKIGNHNRTGYNNDWKTGNHNGAGYNNDWKTGAHNRTGYNNDWRTGNHNGAGYNDNRKTGAHNRTGNDDKVGVCYKSKGNHKNRDKAPGRYPDKYPDRYLGRYPDRDAREALQEFLSHITNPEILSGLEIRGDKVYRVPDRSAEGKRLHFLRNGLYMGDLKKKRFEPSQPLALALSSGDFDRTISIPAEDERLAAYLRGESIPVTAEDFAACLPENGWYLLLTDRYPIGWGKITGSILKNKYPAGWRRQ